VKHRGVKGTQDVTSPAVELWQYLERTAAAVFEDFGFSEIRLPILEYTDVFVRSIGESTDIVEKEMYTFRDKGDRSVTLRPEGTASVVRAYVQHNMAAARPVTRLYYMGPMFRYERPQAGRYRQFHQIGAEVFGVADARLDAEILLMLTVLFERLGLKNLDCQINSIGCPDCRPGYRAAVRDFFRARSGALCDDCRRRLETNPLRIMDCKVPGCVEQRAGAPSIQDHLDAGCRDHFDRLGGFLQGLGVPFTVNPGLVRGLDYYTRTTFEVLAEGLGAQNAVAAGGRYDHLVKSFGGPDTPAMGFAMGVERLVSLVDEARVPRRGPVLFIAALGAAAEARGLEIAAALLKNGVRAEMAYGGSLKSQMKRADRSGAPKVLILGDDELARGAAPLRDMKTREQEEIPLDAVLRRFRPDGAGP